MIKYADLIQHLRKKYGPGFSNLSDEPRPYRAVFWPCEVSPQQVIMSDRGMDSGFPEIEKKFMEDILLIQEEIRLILNTTKKTDKVPGEPTLEEASLEIERFTQARGLALEAWENICNPIQIVGEMVVNVRAPRDIFGSPIIQSISSVHYVREAADDRVDSQVKLSDLERSLTRWKRAVFFLLTLLMLIVVTIFLLPKSQSHDQNSEAISDY